MKSNKKSFSLTVQNCLFKFLLFSLIAFSININALVVLQYHHISEDTPEITSTSPQLFEKHLNYLKENQFKVLSMDEFLTYLKSNKSFPDKSVLITFDDGYQSIYNNALPLLKEKNYPFTVFINTQPIQQKLDQFMNIEVLKKLVKQGGTIGNHSITHTHMIRRDEKNNESEEAWRMRMRNEILQAQKFIDEQITVSPRVFAYPYGEYNHQLKSLIEDLEFVAFAQFSGAIDISTDKQAIARFPMGGQYGKMESFIQKVNTLAMPIESAMLLSEDDDVLQDHVLSQSVFMPKLKIKLKKEYQKINVQCYFSGQGKIKKKEKTDFLIFQSEKRLTSGRSKYNCTAPSEQKNRFYWFSQVWIKRLDNGEWYHE